MTKAAAQKREWPPLHDAQRGVLREIIIHGSQPRVELARTLGLSRTSLTRLARELVELGFLTEGELQHTPGRGRPRELLHVKPEAAHFLGVKLTGDHLYAVVTDLSATVVEERNEPLATTSAEDVADQIAAVATEMLATRALPAAVGVCLAGNVREHFGVQFVEKSRFLGWESVPLASLLEARLSQPVTITNDVVALTGAHHWFGAGVGSSELVVFGVGAGIGAGVVSLNEIVRGAHGRAGRVGHARLAAEGLPCNLGHVDCVQSFVTIPAIEHNAGQPYDAAIVAAKANSPAAVRAFELAARALGIVIAEVVNTVDPEKVLITGEGADMMELAPSALRAGMLEYLENVEPDAVVVERPEFRFADYARGAAVAAMRSVM